MPEEDPVLLERIKKRWRALFRSEELERELDAELRFHLERDTAQKLQSGMSAEEARLAALRSFGGFEQSKEECRDARGVRLLEELWQDLRYGVRSLKKNPGFTTVAVLTLALGIGANTAVFSIINAVLLRSLPFQDAKQMVVLGQISPLVRDRLSVASYLNLVDWREQSDVFAGMAIYRTLGLTLTGAEEPIPLHGAMVSANLFPLLGVTPTLGRAFIPDDDQPGGKQTAMLSYGLWQQRFGADRGILGRTLILNGQSFDVIGVMPPNFTYPVQVDPIELWISTALDAARTGEGQPMTARGYNSYLAVARLKPVVTLAQARSEMDAITNRLAQQYPDNNTNVRVGVVPLLETIVRDVRPILLVLLGAVCCVLLIACVNVANLLLARAAVRQNEIVMRVALGASRWRIVRQLLTESMLLALAGGAAGVLLALLGAKLLIAAAPPVVPRLHEARPDLPVLGFTVLISIATGILFGLVPALNATRLDLTEVIKQGARGTSEAVRGKRLRSLLVVTEIALALVLLVSAGLLVQSFRRLRQVDPGFNPVHVLTIDLRLTGQRYSELPLMADFYRQLIAQVDTLPGVLSASTVSGLPLSGNDASTGFDIEGRPTPRGQIPIGRIRIIGLEYFSTMGISIRKGRDFSPRDDFKAPGVVLINETLAQQYFAGEDPIGQRIKPSYRLRDGDSVKQIIGVVSDVKHKDLSSNAEPEIYLAHAQSPSNSTTLLVRTSGDPSSVAGSVRQKIKALDKNVLISRTRTLEEYVAASTLSSSFVSLLAATFAGVALLLTMVGLYGVMSYTVAQRTHEIGIRIALGAQMKDILRLVIGNGMTLVLVGVAIGLSGAFALTQLMTSLLFGVTPIDVPTFVTVSILLLAVALFACYIPARHAMKVNPLIALRYE